MADQRDDRVPPVRPDVNGEGSGGAAQRVDAWSSAFPAASDARFVLALAAILFALVFAVRVVDVNSRAGLTSLYVVPTTVLALRFGVRGAAAGVAVSVGLVAAWDVGWNIGVGPLGYATRLVAYATVGLGAAWFAARLRMEQEARQRIERQHDSAVAELLRREDDLRAQLAADLHDDTIQGMAAALLALDLIDLQTSSTTMRRAQSRAQATLRATLERTRTHLFGLRPQLLDALGLAGALRTVADRTAADTGLDVRVRLPDGRYPDTSERLVYQVVSGALGYVAAAASTGLVDVVVRDRAGWLEGSIGCDRAGTPRRRARSTGDDSHEFALLSERVRLAGGAVESRTEDSGDRRVEFRIPVMPGHTLPDPASAQGGA